MPIQDHFQFVTQSVRRFHTTGALVPSSPFLAKAMAWPLRARKAGRLDILEVGPGTGAFTEFLVSQMRDRDRLECYELNGEFYGHLRQRLGREKGFQRRAGQVALHHRDILKLPRGRRYDLVICGLPFNNFPADLVRDIMGILYRALKPGATLVYFEYLWMRQAKSAASGSAVRTRLAAVEKVLEGFHRRGTYRGELVWMNLPPALVRSITKAA